MPHSPKTEPRTIARPISRTPISGSMLAGERGYSSSKSVILSLSVSGERGFVPNSNSSKSSKASMANG